MPPPSLKKEEKKNRDSGARRGAGHSLQKETVERNDLLFHKTQRMCYAGTDRTRTNKTCQE